MKKHNAKLTKFLKLASVILFGIVVIIIVFTGSLPQRYNLSVGSVANVDITANRTVTDTYETEKRAVIAKNSVEPIYVQSESVATQNMANITEFFSLVNEIRQGNMDDYGTIIHSKQELANNLAEEVERTYAISLSSEDAYSLANMPTTQLDYVFDEAMSITSVIMMDMVDDSSLSIRIRELTNSVAIIDQSTDTELYASTQELLRTLLAQLLSPNAIYDQSSTDAARNAAYRNTINDPALIEKGTRVISVGETISAHTYQSLLDLDVLETNEFDFSLLFGIVIYITAILFAFGFYLYRKSDELFTDDPKTLLSIALAFLITIITSVYIADFSTLFSAVLFATVIFATYLGIQSGITLSVLLMLVVLPIQKFDVEFVFVTALSVFVCAVIAGQKNRKFNSATLILFTAFTSFSASVGYSLVNQSSKTDMLQSALWSIVSATVCVVAAIGSMPLFELISNSASPMRLIDLAQQGHPLLKKLFLEAPGTSQHSMMVANLADSAAEAIGADALLAKVGAYYHDVGKLENPEYFTENQSNNINPHDQLTPEESVAIITSHTTQGLKYAKKYHLPMAIQNLIIEHHGTTCQQYFYVTAKKNAEEKGLPAPKIEDFTYKGNVPTTKESAIIMLADTCEAAARSTGIKTVSDAETLFRKLVKQKIDQDQLVMSGLSFNELESIIQAFLHVYAGYFHERVKYPE